jgi:hypothetical protein
VAKGEHEQAQVDRDEPHVSVGGLLEKDILDKFWELHRSGSRDILEKDSTHYHESMHKKQELVRKFWNILSTL